MARALMVVRFSVVVVALGMGSFLVGCGSTQTQSPGESPVVCDAEDCPDDCDPSGKFCFERQVWKCALDGNSATVLETCGAAEECRASGQLTRCEPASSGGSAGAPSGTCVPGERQCGEGQVLICNSDGTTLNLYDACELSQACDATTLTCAQVVCEPGAAGCVDTKLAECNPSGTALQPTGEDCLSSGQACDQGACVELVCIPGAKSCVDEGVYQCDSAGLNEVQIETCGLYQHCVVVPGVGGAVATAYCAPNACQPEQVLCDGNFVKVCNDDGTLPADGEDCGAEFCVTGVCLPQICEPYERVCQDGDVYDCTNPGVATQLAESCLEGARCAVLAGGAVCALVPCEAGTTACLGNAYGTCASDGESLTQVTQNCASTQQVCSAVPSCVDSVVETLGAEEKVEGFYGEVFGNIIDVHSDRQLTKLEANLVLESARDLRWVVYELTEEGSYVQRAMDITSNNSGSAFFGSSELTWKLEAGKRYMIGLGLVVFDGYCYYDEAPFDATASFGTILGGARNSYEMENYFYPSALSYRLRITTELP